jgi:hypothetical protein
MCQVDFQRRLAHVKNFALVEFFQILYNNTY